MKIKNNKSGETLILWKICDMVGPETLEIRSLQELEVKELTAKIIFLPSILRLWPTMLQNFQKLKTLMSPNLWFKMINYCPGNP